MNLVPNKNLTQIAKTLRNKMTKEEKHLWYDFLSKYKIKFYRQKIIGNFVVDFYCAKAKLILELDGSQHYETNIIKKDIDRTSFFNSLGLSVVRISNFDINSNFKGVCEYIDNIVNNLTENYAKEK